jgi:hypothetical protein
MACQMLAAITLPEVGANFLLPNVAFLKKAQIQNQEQQA